MKTITPKQKKVLDFITSFIQKNDYSPTLAEIARHFRKAPPTISQYLQVLEKKKILKREKGAVRGLSLAADSLKSITDQTVKRIGIVGFGIVGQAVKYGFSREEIHVYDKYKDSETLPRVVAKSDYLFICLPTPIKKDKSGIDLKIVNQNIHKIASLTKNTDKIIVIKSTIIPGTTKSFIKKYPQSLFCFNPEFLTERNFLQDFINSDRIIIGAEDNLVFRRVSALYQKIMPKTPIFQTDPTTAEMVKYMANCFLATKVIFANEMNEICQKLKIKYEEVKKMVAADSRIFDSHLEITTLGGFGGKCLPKDLLALKALAEKKGVNTKILEAVWQKNLDVRKIRDWEEIPFAVSRKGFGHRS
ncbi:MAG: nucleotide sugar dehydrogenase [Candidatus Pacebacteria bacterium]|nr:nucleotide sugar dehydrogenase [Candidatus Paceibacterota bacterium]